jgi:hypothetical protein
LSRFFCLPRDFPFAAPGFPLVAEGPPPSGVTIEVAGAMTGEAPPEPVDEADCLGTAVLSAVSAAFASGIEDAPAAGSVGEVPFISDADGVGDACAPADEAPDDGAPEGVVDDPGLLVAVAHPGALEGLETPAVVDAVDPDVVMGAGVAEVDPPGVDAAGAPVEGDVGAGLADATGLDAITPVAPEAEDVSAEAGAEDEAISGCAGAEDEPPVVPDNASTGAMLGETKLASVAVEPSTGARPNGVVVPESAAEWGLGAGEPASG